MKDKQQQIDFLTTGVGRGHRFYLEGLRAAVQRCNPEIETGLFLAPDVSGAVAGLGWRLIMQLYRKGSSSGIFGSWYRHLRSQNGANAHSEPGKALQLFGAGLRRWWQSRGNPLIVDHPLLVRLLSTGKRVPPLIYIHGELVAPAESLVHGADITIVPTEDVKRQFAEAGIAPNSIFVSGICIEKSLTDLAEQASHLRLKRLRESATLTGAYFSSGAEPLEHCRLILSAVRSCPVQSSDSQNRRQQRALVFAVEEGRLADMLATSGMLEKPGVRLLTYKSMSDEERQLAQAFTEIDYYVAPAHERTNWAVGLGLPFFALLPCFGSYAPLNLQLAQRHAHAKTVASIPDAERFSETLNELQHSGELETMNCFGARYGDSPPNAINGFENGAKMIEKKLFQQAVRK